MAIQSRSFRYSAALTSAFFMAACGGGGGDSDSAMLSGEVLMDGSSTVFPIGEAFGEEFQIAHPGVRVSVGFSGTGGGFKRFCSGETDFSQASRPISDSEREACAANGIEFTEFPIAWDGLSVIVNPENDFVQCLTVDELRRLWEPASTVRTWRDIRAEWPAETIKLYGAGTDSGTFDYFTEVIMGESGASRPDYQASEDDNILVQGVTGDLHSLGYFGYHYYVESADRLKLVAVDGGNGCVAPSEETIADGSYAPLSRPLMEYVNNAALSKPQVRAFAEFMFQNGTALVPATGYHALSAEEYAEDLARLRAVMPAN